jgi:hypothetical protein
MRIRIKGFADARGTRGNMPVSIRDWARAGA